MAACGHRTRASAQHYLAIESLAYTLGLPGDAVHRRQTYRRMRAWEERTACTPRPPRPAHACGLGKPPHPIGERLSDRRCWHLAARTRQRSDRGKG